MRMIEWDWARGITDDFEKDMNGRIDFGKGPDWRGLRAGEIWSTSNPLKNRVRVSENTILLVILFGIAMHKRNEWMYVRETKLNRLTEWVRMNEQK